MPEGWGSNIDAKKFLLKQILSRVVLRCRQKSIRDVFRIRKGLSTLAPLFRILSCQRNTSRPSPPRRGDTHTVQVTPYKRSAVWCQATPVNLDQSQHPKVTTKISESHPRQGIHVCSSIGVDRSLIGVVSELIGVLSELYRSLIGVVSELYRSCIGVASELHRSYIGVASELDRS